MNAQFATKHGDRSSLGRSSCGCHYASTSVNPFFLLSLKMSKMRKFRSGRGEGSAQKWFISLRLSRPVIPSVMWAETPSASFFQFRPRFRRPTRNDTGSRPQTVAAWQAHRVGQIHSKTELAIGGCRAPMSFYESF